MVGSILGKNQDIFSIRKKVFESNMEQRARTTLVLGESGKTIMGQKEEGGFNANYKLNLLNHTLCTKVH